MMQVRCLCKGGGRVGRIRAADVHGWTVARHHHLDVVALTCALSVMMDSSCRGEGNYQAVRKVRLHPCATCKAQHARGVLLWRPMLTQLLVACMHAQVWPRGQDRHEDG